MTLNALYREKDTDDYVAAKYMILEKKKVVAEAEILRDLIQSAFILKLVGLYHGPLHNILVTEFLSGGDLVTRWKQFYVILTPLILLIAKIFFFTWSGQLPKSSVSMKENVKFLFVRSGRI